MRFYAALLHLFPKSFRAEYGRDMRADFEREWTAATGFARLSLAAAAIADVIGNAARVHVDILRQDVKFSLRSLRRTPGFAITATVVAALGIGATTAAFTVADHVLLKSLPFPESSRILKIWQSQPSRGYPRLEPSPPNFRDWKRMSTSFEEMDAYAADSLNLMGVGEPERLLGARVTGGMFRLLRRDASIGRVLLDADITRETDDPIVLADSLWRTKFGADPNVIGRTVSFDNVTCIVVGVMPRDFTFPSAQTQFWRALRFSPQAGDDDRGNHLLNVIGRLKDGVTIESARSELDVIARQLEAQFPKELAQSGIYTMPWRDDVAWQSRMLVIALAGASLCVLLIACTNLANLLLTRALARRGELAIRAAIGASLDRLVRQLLTESVLLSLAGGVVGVALAVVAGPLIARVVPATQLPMSGVPSPDLRMLIAAGILAIATGLLFGVVPAMRVSRNADAAMLKEGARGGTTRTTERLRSILVVAEIAASIVLLVAAGLLIQALLRVQAVDPGFKADHVLSMKSVLPRPKYSTTARRMQFYNQVIANLKAQPGVTDAAYISFLPMTFRGGIWRILSTQADPNSPEGFVSTDPLHEKSASIRYVTPGFFSVMRTPLLRGRDVRDSDTLDTPLVAVVSASLAQQQFPGEDPIGKQFAIAYGVRTIVGIVGDIRVRGLERESEPQVYMPASQQQDGFLGFYAPADLVVRTAVAPESLIAVARETIWKAEPQMPITSVQTLEDVVAGETAPRLVQLHVLGGFAAVALLLAAIGIHGLLAFTVSARMREIGVRIALGAGARDIMWIVMGRSTMLAVIGVAIGGGLAYAAGRSLQALLFGVSPGDVSVFGGAIAVAFLMTLAGSVLPALRAIRVDPITATRTD